MATVYRQNLRIRAHRARDPIRRPLRGIMVRDSGGAPPPSGVQILAVTDDPRNAGFLRVYTSSPFIYLPSDAGLIVNGHATNNDVDTLVNVYTLLTVPHAIVTGTAWSVVSAISDWLFRTGESITDLTQTGTVAAITTAAVSTTSWTAPATVGVVYADVPDGSSFIGNTASGYYIVQAGAAHAVNVDGGNVTLSYKTNTLGSPAVTNVSASGIDSHKTWTFSNVFASQPSVPNVACLQVLIGGSWESPSNLEYVDINGVKAQLILYYSDDADPGTNWRINGSTSGLSFAGGGTLLTGVSGSIS